MVNVKLIHKDRDLKTAALIDSGSTFDFLPRELAEILDLFEEPRDAYVQEAHLVMYIH